MTAIRRGRVLAWSVIWLAAWTVWLGWLLGGVPGRWLPLAATCLYAAVLGAEWDRIQRLGHWVGMTVASWVMSPDWLLSPSPPGWVHDDGTACSHRLLCPVGANPPTKPPATIRPSSQHPAGAGIQTVVHPPGLQDPYGIWMETEPIRGSGWRCPPHLYVMESAECVGCGAPDFIGPLREIAERYGETGHG